MSVVELLPLDGGKAVAIPSDKTTVGRGPFLEITDKRVSRNHATLEIIENKLILTPIHTNPCFFRSGGESPQITLEKDLPKPLQHNDVIGLLPDKLFFRVIYKNHKKTRKIKEEKLSLENGGTDEEKKVATAMVKKKPMALPLDKTRKLPSWMKGAAKRSLGAGPSQDPVKQPARRVAENVRTPVKKQGGRTKVAPEKESVTPARRPRTASLKSPKYSEDYAVSNADLGLSSGSESQSKAGRTDDDSDFNVNNDSDWDKPSKKTKGRGSKGLKPKGRGRRRGKTRNSYEDDEDEDESSEEEYTHKTSRRRSRQQRSSISESDDEVDMAPRRQTKRKKVESEEESDSENKDRTSRKRKKDETRDMCQYGVKCYRKNPTHFEEFSHPGDASWDSDQADNGATNRKKGRPKRAAREKDKRSALHGASDDDGEANTYDYDDSFIHDDDASSSESSFSNPDSDSDWEPEVDSGEDIRGLVREAKGFVRNKKMARPTRQK